MRNTECFVPPYFSVGHSAFIACNALVAARALSRNNLAFHSNLCQTPQVLALLQSVFFDPAGSQRIR